MYGGDLMSRIKKVVPKEEPAGGAVGKWQQRNPEHGRDQVAVMVFKLMRVDVEIK